MSIAFVTRPPSYEEVELLRLALSSFQDGSGQERDGQGNTRAGWRDLERVVAELLSGKAPENKELFDIVVVSTEYSEISYGISVKSKELRRKSAIADLSDSGRVYMELCNSPAKLWDPLNARGIGEADFHAQRHPQEIGQSILSTVHNWHTVYKTLHELSHATKIDLDRSVYLVLSYSPSRQNSTREYQFHSFDLAFPDDLEWFYRSPRCLRAHDPNFPDEVLLEWYALSGGQLKYYPRAASCRFASRRFSLIQPRLMTIKEKASRYWPQEWVAAKGEVVLTPSGLADEVEGYADLFGTSETQKLIIEFARRLRGHGGAADE